MKNSGKRRQTWKRTSFGSGFFLFIFAFLISVTPSHSNSEQELMKIRVAIKTNQLEWIAGDTTISQLSEEEFRMHLGADNPIPNPIPLTKWSYRPAEFPDYLDWRAKDNACWVTPIKNQGNCGSCWAFAAAALIESVYRIQHNRPDIDIDISEQYMVSCSGAGNCVEGGSGYEALRASENIGVPLEMCFFYQASDVPCNPCPEWANSRYYSRNSMFVTYETADNEAIIAALQEGPIVTRLEVYKDFQYYRSGIYTLTPNQKYIGGHLVLIVGYDKNQRYWICKNSWGTGWGENGYFNIRWNEVGVGTWTIKISSVFARKSVIGR